MSVADGMLTMSFETIPPPGCAVDGARIVGLTRRTSVLDAQSESELAVPEFSASHRSSRSGVNMSDIELVERASARDVDAFEELMNRHRRVISSVCWRMTLNHHDAEDAVAAVQWAVWRNLPGFEGRAAFSTWLYQVAYTTTIGLRRKRVPEPVAEVPERPASRRSPQDDVVDFEALRWALTHIPDDFRAALLMKECDGLSLEEIAEIQIVAVGTVKSRIARAREMLTRLIEGGDR